VARWCGEVYTESRRGCRGRRVSERGYAAERPQALFLCVLLSLILSASLSLASLALALAGLAGERE